MSVCQRQTGSPWEHITWHLHACTDVCVCKSENVRHAQGGGLGALTGHCERSVAGLSGSGKECVSLCICTVTSGLLTGSQAPVSLCGRDTAPGRASVQVAQAPPLSIPGRQRQASVPASTCSAPWRRLAPGGAGRAGRESIIWARTPGATRPSCGRAGPDPPSGCSR